MAVEHAVPIRPVIAHCCPPGAKNLGVTYPVDAAKWKGRKGNQLSKVFDDAPASFVIDLQDIFIGRKRTLRPENLQERFSQRQARRCVPCDACALLGPPLQAACAANDVLETDRRTETFRLEQILAVPEKIERRLQRDRI